MAKIRAAAKRCEAAEETRAKGECE